jgi:hypothetical protein
VEYTFSRGYAKKPYFWCIKYGRDRGNGKPKPVGTFDYEMHDDALKRKKNARINVWTNVFQWEINLETGMPQKGNTIKRFSGQNDSYGYVVNDTLTAVIA